MQSHILTESQILEALFRFPAVVSWLYDQARRGGEAKAHTALGTAMHTILLLVQFSARHRPRGASGRSDSQRAAASSSGSGGASPVGGADDEEPVAWDGSTRARPLSKEECVAHVKRAVKTSDDDLAVFLGFVEFNFAVQRTNFFRA